MNQELGDLVVHVHHLEDRGAVVGDGDVTILRHHQFVQAWMKSLSLKLIIVSIEQYNMHFIKVEFHKSEDLKRPLKIRINVVREIYNNNLPLGPRDVLRVLATALAKIRNKINN